mmetsp:Transcript_24010/g.66774  ORF Transcript_24010/g.66774 Transcript_24010/m.66774 type:complete len:248 (-) Transcript_24010:55-798(-)
MAPTRGSATSFFAALATALLTRSPDVAAADKVVVLDASSFNGSLAEPSPIFVKFYAPWCKHCKDMAPAWTALAAAEPGDIRIGKVDCTAEGAKVLTQRFGIHGYPTLLLFAGGGSKIYKHDGGRSLAALTAFASGGWREVEEYDPTAPPKHSRGVLRGYAVYIILGLMGFSCILGLCCQLFGTSDPPVQSLRKVQRPSSSTSSTTAQEHAMRLRSTGRAVDGSTATPNGDPADAVAEANGGSRAHEE